jgi:sterol 14alpha-demethylase
MAWTIRLDEALCQGHGVCESEASEVFVVPKRAVTVTILTESPDDALRSAVEAAVRYCPTHALRIEETD